MKNKHQEVQSQDPLLDSIGLPLSYLLGGLPSIISRSLTYAMNLYDTVSGYSQGVAGEESPLAGVVRCAQGDDGEHPGDSDTLLHGLQTGSGVSQSDTG